MKKILFISNRNPFLERYSGDVIRAKKFVNFLSRNNYIKIISPNQTDTVIKKSRLNYEGFKQPNIILKILYIFSSLLKFQPMQLGYFFNPKIKDFLLINEQLISLIFILFLLILKF